LKKQRSRKKGKKRGGPIKVALRVKRLVERRGGNGKKNFSEKRGERTCSILGWEVRIRVGNSR